MLKPWLLCNLLGAKFKNPKTLPKCNSTPVRVLGTLRYTYSVAAREQETGMELSSILDNPLWFVMALCLPQYEVLGHKLELIEIQSIVCEKAF